jgi:hypothetical protein
MLQSETKSTAYNKGFAIAGGAVIRRHISARWKFSSPNEVYC